MDTSKVLADAFTHHLDGLMTTLSKIVSDGTNFGKYASFRCLHYHACEARYTNLFRIVIVSLRIYRTTW